MTHLNSYEFYTYPGPTSIRLLKLLLSVDETTNRSLLLVVVRKKV